MIVRQIKGVTLIELLIVLVISAILVAGIYSVFIIQQKAYSVQAEVSAIQQDTRVSLVMMSQEIRMAGLLAGAGSGSGFTDGTNNITVNGFTSAVVPVNSTSGPDGITVVYAAAELGTVQSVGAGVLTLDNDVDSYFKDGGGSLIAENCFVAFDIRSDKVYQVSAVSGTNVTVVSLPSFTIPDGTTVYGVKAITYSVASGVLRRDENTGDGPQPLAGDGTSTVVEDVQFAYQLRGDTTWYNGGGFPAGTSNADIRMVRINIAVRTGIEDLDDANYTRPALEDHPAGTTNDGYRRRVYATVVKIRNLGG